MRYGLILLATLISGMPSSAVRADGTPTVVVELFTSQGCSSCPPAEAFIGELVGREGILPLSLHVNYWDYIGWKDLFADSRHTMRQREYANSFRLRSVYTPQIVVQGRFENVGSDQRKTLLHIEKARKERHIHFSLRHEKDGHVVIDLPETSSEDGQRPDAEVLLVTFDREHRTQVKRGENQGRHLINFNVVRSIQNLGDWRGEARRLRSMPKRWAHSGDACAVIVQERMGGPILGALAVDLDTAR